MGVVLQFHLASSASAPLPGTSRPTAQAFEVETETEKQVKEALAAGADIIMLDNTEPQLMTAMVQLINGKAKVETSGNITAENIRIIAATVSDLISVGEITYSAGALNISLKMA